MDDHKSYPDTTLAGYRQPTDTIGRQLHNFI